MVFLKKLKDAYFSEKNMYAQTAIWFWSAVLIVIFYMMLLLYISKSTLSLEMSGVCYFSLLFMLHAMFRSKVKEEDKAISFIVVFLFSTIGFIILNNISWVLIVISYGIVAFLKPKPIKGDKWNS